MATSSSLRIVPAAALAVIASLGIAGCSHNTPDNGAAPSTTVVTTQPAPANPPAAAPVPGPAANTANAPGTNNVNAGPGGATGAQADVADAVNKAIHTNVQLTGSRITAVVDATGVATLTGTAQNQQQKALAVRAATNTAGVTSVKDKIEIVPTGGAKAKVATTKVIHETKIVVVPGKSSTAGSTSGNSAAGAGDNTSSGNDNSAGSDNADTTNAPAGNGSSNNASGSSNQGTTGP